jgi:hypothetical protein
MLACAQSSSRAADDVCSIRVSRSVPEHLSWPGFVRAFELGVEIGRLKEPNSKLTLYDIVAWAGVEKAEGFGQHVAFQVSSREGVQEFVPKLAHLVQKYGAPFLKSDTGVVSNK